MDLLTVVQISETIDGCAEWAICEVIGDRVCKRAQLGLMSQDELIAFARESLGGGPVHESSRCVMGERVIIFTRAANGDFFNFEGGKALPIQEGGCLLVWALLLAVSLLLVAIMMLV